MDNAPNVFINGGVILDSEGNVYGTTSYGGVEGMIYKIDPARQETTLYSFQGAPGGTKPDAGITIDAAGNFYGVTQDGGAPDWGVVYKIDPSGHEAALYTFTGGADDAAPEFAPVADSSGNLYGTTMGGGSGFVGAGFGVVYKLDPSGQETVLHSFTGGAGGGLPGWLIRDSAGNLYGTAAYGPPGSGVVFEIDAAGNYSILYAFSGGTDGGFGVIFELNPSGQETVLYSFTGGLDGAGPNCVTRDAAGNFYGTTTAGGVASGFGSGVVFELDAAGAYRVLYAFTGGADGGLPFSGVVRDAEGNLYGTTSSGGINCATGGLGNNCRVVYRLSPSGEETVLHSFTGGGDGANPSAGLVLDAAGNLYGTTPWGGKGGFSSVAFSGGGVVFEIKE